MRLDAGRGWGPPDNAVFGSDSGIARSCDRERRDGRSARFCSGPPTHRPRDGELTAHGRQSNVPGCDPGALIAAIVDPRSSGAMCLASSRMSSFRRAAPAIGVEEAARRRSHGAVWLVTLAVGLGGCGGTATTRTTSAVHVHPTQAAPAYRVGQYCLPSKEAKYRAARLR